MAWPGESWCALERTVRALALVDKPISVRSLAGSHGLGPVIAALRWLLERGYVASGTAHTRAYSREPVYWLTPTGVELHRRLTHRDTGPET